MCKLLETELGPPAEPVVCVRRVADQPVDAGGWEFVIEEFQDLARDMFLTGLVGSHAGTLSVRAEGRAIISRRGARLGGLTDEDLIEFDIAGDFPETARVEIAQHELVLETERDRRGAVRDLARQELQWSSRRLVVVEDAGAGEETVLATIGMHDEMRVGLRDAVGRYRLQRSLLGLRTLARLAEDFARGGLVEADGRVFGADRFEQRGCANRGELGRVDGAVP